MKRIFTQAALLTLLLAPLGGCSRLHYHAGPAKPVLANAAIAQPHRVSSQFKEEGRRFYTLWGLAPIGGFDGTDLIAARLAQGDGIINLSAHERFAFVDHVTAFFTLGLLSSRTVEVRGDIFVYDPPITIRPGTTVIVPHGEGTIVVPPKDGTVVVPPENGTVVVPPSSSGTVVVP